ncbi:TonB family protein [Rufibacter sp. LB8]|uniref:TonB family protein n=1 Tax=Rufibacter sp. LB8 TaxID=2777781 RepID=UPI00178C7FA5|nr:TonB family protein [Rufibacter sp. LB8]
MSFSRLVVLLVLVGCSLVSWGQIPTNATSYAQEISRHRAKEDSVFKHSENSPLSALDKATFNGLPYFAVNEAYKVKAQFVRTAQETIFKMPTTTGRQPDYLKYGELHFSLQGQPLRLSVYQSQELISQPKYMTYLFIPFTDATTGQETYETGRYLDFAIPMTPDSVWLDFNLAYNPYCAYSPEYSCPIPPKENKLPVRIEAGVKRFEKKEQGPEIQSIGSGDIMPEFPGGILGLMTFMKKTFEMPLQAKRAGVEGTVEFSFVIMADGTTDDFKIVKSLRPDVDIAVLNAAKQMPLWKPAEQAGRKVRFRYTMPYRVTGR